MQQQARALEVREKVEAETMPFGSALKQARHVEDGDLTIDREIDHAENGLNRGERIIGDFRLGVRDAAQQRRLTDVRKAEQCGVGEQLELQRERKLLSQAAELGGTRSLAHGGSEATIPRAAATAVGDDRRSAWFGKVDDQHVLVVQHLGPHRHGHDQIDAHRAGAVRSLAPVAFVGREVRMVANRRQIA